MKPLECRLKHCNLNIQCEHDIEKISNYEYERLDREVSTIRQREREGERISPRRVRVH